MRKNFVLIILSVVVVFIIVVGARFIVAQFTLFTFIAAVLIHDCDCGVVIANTRVQQVRLLLSSQVKMAKEGCYD